MDLNGQMARLDQRVADLSGNVTELGKQVHHLQDQIVAQGESLSARIIAQGENLNACIIAQGERLGARITEQGERISKLEQDLAVIKSNYATKADVLAVKVEVLATKSSIIMWVVSAVFLAQLLPELIKRLGG